MAAHGLTICRQLLKRANNGCSTEDLKRWTWDALSAPGTCFSASFDWDMWRDLERAQDSGDRQRMVESITASIDRHIWMDAYPTMEAVQEAKRAYVRWHTPYYRRRVTEFDSGNAKAHETARAAIVSHYPLDRRAPTF